MAQMEGRLEYVRGLLEAQELTEDERRDRALVALVDQVSALTTRVAELTAEVTVLRARLVAPESAAPEPGARVVFCPACAARIPLPRLGSTPLELDCPQCGATLEVA